MKHKSVFAAVLAGFVLLIVGGIYFRRHVPATHSIAAPHSAPRPSPNQPEAVVSPNAVIYYLFDISRSFYTKDKSCLYTKSVGLMEKAVPAIQSSMPPPQRHIFGVISSYSRREDPVCDFTTGMNNPFHAEGESTSDKVAKCVAALRNQVPSELSDIHGAIAVAAEQLSGYRSAAKAIIVFTDLDEDYKGEANREAARPDLAGDCVVVYYEDLRQASIQNPKLMTDRVKFWRNDLANQGAQSVEVLPLRSFTSDAVADFARRCK